MASTTATATTKAKISPTQRALNLWAVILIIWAFYRAYLHLPEWFDEFIAKPAVFILPVYWYITRYEKKKFLKSIDLRFNQLGADLLVGFGVGGVFAASALLANFMKFGHLVLFQNTSPMDFAMIGYLVVLALATGVSEEILSRGFVLKRLYEDSKNMITSSFIASVLFFFLHVPILFTSGIKGNTLIVFMVTDVVLSLACCIIFLTRRSLIPPILIHAIYNIALIALI